MRLTYFYVYRYARYEIYQMAMSTSAAMKLVAASFVATAIASLRKLPRSGVSSCGAVYSYLPPCSFSRCRVWSTAFRPASLS
jgi:hypothetical protein